MSGTTEIAAQAAATGASAFLVATLGIEGQALAWACVGSIFGVALAPKTGLLYAVALFVAATLTCALLGTAMGQYFSPGSMMTRNACSVAMGAAFHPILAAFIGSVPSLMDGIRIWILRRFGVDINERP